jgi:hypothetical protein
VLDVAGASDLLTGAGCNEVRVLDVPFPIPMAFVAGRRPS